MQSTKLNVPKQYSTVYTNSIWSTSMDWLPFFDSEVGKLPYAHKMLVCMCNVKNAVEIRRLLALQFYFIFPRFRQTYVAHIFWAYR